MINVKIATIKDLDALTKLFDLYRVFYEQKSDKEGAKQFLKERLVNKESVVFIAFEDDQPLGFAQLYPSFSSVSMKRTWVLNDLFVKKEVRGKGIGNRLLNEAIQMAAETGAKGILLETGTDNLTAQKLYEKTGFKRESNFFYFFAIV